MGKMITVFYTAHARKDLLKLEKLISKRVVLTVLENTKIDPLKNAKTLKGIFSGMYRYRVGDYRVIFETNENEEIIIVAILRIKHRKDIYRV